MLLVKSNLRDLVSSVKQLLSSHGRLLSDVKTLLKTMAKVSVRTRLTLPSMLIVIFVFRKKTKTEEMISIKWGVCASTWNVTRN